MTHPLLARLSLLAAYALAALAFVPLLWLSYYSHPSAADDFCFADTAQRYGFWQAQQYYYDGWTGRYFSNFLVHGSPLVWGWYGGFKLVPLAAAGGWVAGAYLFLAQALRGLLPAAHRRHTAFLLTGFLFFLYMLALPSPVEAFFWLASVAVYTVPTALLFYWGAVVMRWNGQPTGVLFAATGLWASVLVFLVVGCGETHMLLIISVLLAIIFYELVFRRVLAGRLVWLLAVAVVSGWLVFRAPGNAIRMNGGAGGGNVVRGLGMSVRWLAGNLPAWFLQTPLLPLSLIWLTVGATYLRACLNRGGALPALFRVPLWYGSVVVAGLLLATVLPSFYATQFVTLRAVNITYAVFLVGWFYLLTTQLPRMLPVLPPTGPLLPGWLLAFTGVCVAASLWAGQPLKQLYRDLLRGDAAQYDREMTLRHQQLRRVGPVGNPSTATPDTIRLPPLTVLPPSLFLEDLRPNPAHWWNRCQAGYYGHAAIIIDSTLTGHP